MSYFFAILKNETEEDHQGWLNACKHGKYNVRFKIIDMTRNDWLEHVVSEDFDCFLARPPAGISYFKQLYDERIYAIHNLLKKKIYPSYDEMVIYENKRMLFYWLAAHKIPHPRTWILYHRDEALKFVTDCTLPIVAKTAIGASGSGVLIIRDTTRLRRYIDRAFSEKGILRKWGPNLRKGDLLKRVVSRLQNIPQSYDYFRKKHASAAMSRERWFVIFQEYIQCDFEWRAVRIGDSYFAHKKIRKRGEMFSGTSEVRWDAPPERLLNFVKYVCDTGKFLSQAVDIFEDEHGNYLVNELQCFFGSKHPHQMILNGKPGRYIDRDGRWIFEEGNFNTNDSFDLRLAHVIQLLETGRL